MHDSEKAPSGAAALDGLGPIPKACIADGKGHIRTFLVDALEDLGFATCECLDGGDMPRCLAIQTPDLVVLGLSDDGNIARHIIAVLAAAEFAGKVMAIGPRESPTTRAVQETGENAGLAMLPCLHTPFSAGTLREALAAFRLEGLAPTPAVDITEALRAGWLELCYQHKIDARTLVPAGAEAMVRIRHPQLGVVSPARFKNDDRDPLFRALSEFMIFRAIRDWRTLLAHQGPVDLSINLPVSFLEQPRAVRDLCSWMPADAGFGGLIIELDCADLVGKLDRMIEVAREVRRHNIALSIDGVGADWPLLMYIDAFPFVELKVDSAFVAGSADDRLKQTVCRRIVELAAGYGARTVATGVETRADYRSASELGFDLVQGTLFGKPAGVMKFARSGLLRPLTASR